MKLFITGVSGLLGLNVALQLRDRYEISGCYYSHTVATRGVQALKLDLSTGPEIDKVLHQIQPEIIVQTVGLTNVEACESDPGLAYLLNVEVARHTAELARTLGAKLVHISSDHLFDGKNPLQQEEDAPTPLNIYAKTKLRGEEAVLQSCPDALVIRTNFFGWGTGVRTSLSDWIINGLREGRELNMFSDVFFTPLMITDLAELILRLVDRSATGIFNLGGAERLSKYDFALKSAEIFNYSTDRIRAISIDDFSFNAQRPKDMSLSSNKAEGFLETPMPTVAESLKRLKTLELDGYPKVLEQAVRQSAIL